MLPLKDNIPTRRIAYLTVAIIVANVLAFFFFQDARLSLAGASIDEANAVEFGAIPYEISHWGSHCAAAGREIECGSRPVPGAPPTLATLFTSMFMHGGLLHLAGNMLFLWIFGNNVEDAMGHVKFVVFYLLGGLAALALHVVTDLNSTTPTLGASGAIAAILGAYALLFPRARVITVIFIVFFFTILELPAMVVLGLWFLLQLFYGTADVATPAGGGGGVAYFAHIGGFVYGLLLIRLFASRQKNYTVPPKYPVY